MTLLVASRNPSTAGLAGVRKSSSASQSSSSPSSPRGAPTLVVGLGVLHADVSVEAPVARDRQCISLQASGRPDAKLVRVGGAGADTDRIEDVLLACGRGE